MLSPDCKGRYAGPLTSSCEEGGALFEDAHLLSVRRSLKLGEGCRVSCIWGSLKEPERESPLPPDLPRPQRGFQRDLALGPVKILASAVSPSSSKPCFTSATCAKGHKFSRRSPH